MSDTLVRDTDTAEEGRSKRLKTTTSGTHLRLDERIMAARPFESRERYAAFAATQYLFHRDIDALYLDRSLQAIVPDLAGRRRLSSIAADLADLGFPLPESAPYFAPASAPDLPTALGWLYVAEGSNLGAAFLLKFAAKLGLSEAFGARHLAGAPEGRARHWRQFTGALDAVNMTPSEEARLAKGAHQAFIRVHNLVTRHLP
ncbi:MULTISPECIES: biliverdin-producing heme oxygenase [unclassified Aureimonas]|uniref:biliverdin-producing heme oxygenase n=1 Tax=unclassified Aureimonas TaxID=2615206 RepID=UPI0012E3AAB5|nr:MULTISPECIES: biliverdin-producing heme oxygenase [unclassified Aureimonas]